MTTVETSANGTADIAISRLGEEPGTITMKVEVGVARVRATEQKAAAVLAKRVRLPGFRKGRVPVQVVKRQFRDALREEVVRSVIGDSWQLALDQEKLAPIGDPRVSNVSFPDEAPLTFELQVDVKPEIVLDRIGGFMLSRPKVAVSDEMVREQLDELRRRRAPWVPVADGPPAMGDMVEVTLATIEGETVDAEPRPYQLVLGEGQAIPELEERILGMTPGDTRETTVRYPEDFTDETKRGQTRTVRITLREVKRQELPPLDDAFAREVGEFDSLDALRAAIRQDIAAAAARDADADVRRQLVDEIISANALEAPRALVHRVLGGFAQAYEVPDDRLEEFAREFGPIAARQVQRDLIIEHVATRESLAATEEDLDARIAEIAARRGEEPKAVYASLQKAKRLRELEHSITEEKVFDYLLAQSTVSET